jgi:hypothetical protein
MALQITRRRATVKFYPDQGVAARIDAAEAKLAAAKAEHEQAVNDPGRTMASTAVRKATKAVEQAQADLDAVKAEAASTVLDLTLEALPRKRWAEALAAHPARDGDKVDAMYGLNWDTFLAEVLAESVLEVRDAAGEIVEVTPEEWVAAADEVTDGQYTSLMIAIASLNRGSDAPF